MIIKPFEARENDLLTLTQLLSLPHIPQETQHKIQQEIKKIQSGIKGEKEAAYQIDFHYTTSKNWMVIHDLRLEFNGLTAQIDHLLINRFLEIYVCESKNFSEGIAINEQGEFSAFYQRKPYGIPSPIEQNNRHIALLKKLFDGDAVDLPSRLGFKMKPTLISLILIANSARISRPNNGRSIQGLDRIIKMEQIKSKIEKDINNPALMMTTVKLVSSETLQIFAESLASLHQAANIDWYARFGISHIEAVCTDMEEPVSVVDQPIENKSAATKEDTAAKAEEPAKRLICATCGVKVNYHVGVFCWRNKKRFHGDVYCYECQKKIPAA